jgi:hypothetical protein
MSLDADTVCVPRQGAVPFTRKRLWRMCHERLLGHRFLVYRQIWFNIQRFKDTLSAISFAMSVKFFVFLFSLLFSFFSQSEFTP